MLWSSTFIPELTELEHIKNTLNVWILDILNLLFLYQISCFPDLFLPLRQISSNIFHISYSEMTWRCFALTFVLGLILYLRLNLRISPRISTALPSSTTNFILVSSSSFFTSHSVQLNIDPRRGFRVRYCLFRYNPNTVFMSLLWEHSKSFVRGTFYCM